MDFKSSVNGKESHIQKLKRKKSIQLFYTNVKTKKGFKNGN